MRVADRFTLARAAFAPVFFALYQLSRFWGGTLSLVLFALLVVLLIFAELTDFWDGYYARKRGEVSDGGKLFDPFADALLHITIFFCMVQNGLMPAAAFILIFWREFGQMFLRMMSIKGGYAVAARGGGKLKTVVYIASNFYALALEGAWKLGLTDTAARAPRAAAAVLFYLCVLLAYISFADYLLLLKNKIFKKK